MFEANAEFERSSFALGDSGSLSFFRAWNLNQNHFILFFFKDREVNYVNKLNTNFMEANQ